MRLEESPLNETIELIGVNLDSLVNNNEMIIASTILAKCIKKIKEMEDNSKQETEAEYQLIINDLFAHINKINHSILVTLLDSWGDAR